MAISAGGGSYAPKTAIGLLVGILAFYGVMLRLEYNEDVKWPEDNHQAVARQFAQLDAQKTLLFNSAAACVAAGYHEDACAMGQSNAHRIAEQAGTRLETESAFDCAQTYGQCGTIYGAKGHKTFYPLMVGWQAAANDLSKAVPLFSTPRHDRAMRGDGKIFALNH